MSGQPLGDFFLDYYGDHQAEQQVEQQVDRRVDMLLADAHQRTGLTAVRSDYGFAGAGQTVAVIDSGIAWDHIALGGGFGSGYRVVGGWDFTGENDANPYDDGPNGSHGTHVSGIIGGDAGANSGVASEVDLVALRVFDDSGAGYFSWIESALQWVHANRNAFDNPITTVNLSVGTSWNSDSVPSWAMLEDEFSQLEADGIFISVAAGNSFTRYNTTGLSYPAASSYVVPVMATDNDGSLSFFSQRHQRAIAAPGRWITSTVPDYVGDQNGIADDYASYSGTSMATPYIAGASVLVREAMEFVGYTNITQDMIYDHMNATADLIFDSVTNQTYNRLNLEAAIDALMSVDDYGSTVANAHSLGTLESTLSVSGVIGTLNDIDYFSFAAGANGTVSMSVSGDHDLLPNVTVIGANSTLENNILSFDVVDGGTYTISIETADGNGIGYYAADLSLAVAELPVAAVTVKTMIRGNGHVYSLDSENWLSINGSRTWGNTSDFALANDGSVYWFSTTGVLQRMSPQGSWTTLHVGATKFDVTDAGVAYSLDNDGWLKINGSRVWGNTGDFEIATDQTIFWHASNGLLQHRLSDGSWETLDTDAARFAVRSDGTVYSLGTDGWLNINGSAVWGGTHDFAFTDDQTLFWHATNGALHQLSNNGSWQALDTGVTEFAVRHDGANYSLANDGNVSLDGVVTWSNIVDIRTDEVGYLVLENADGSSHREAGRFTLSNELTLENNANSQSMAQAGVREASSRSAGYALDSMIRSAPEMFNNSQSAAELNDRSAMVNQYREQVFSQSTAENYAAYAWEDVLMTKVSPQDLAWHENDLAAGDEVENEIMPLDTDAVDSLFEQIGVLL